jgi:hypothetical protein
MLTIFDVWARACVDKSILHIIAPHKPILARLNDYLHPCDLIAMLLAIAPEQRNIRMLDTIHASYRYDLLACMHNCDGVQTLTVDTIYECLQNAPQYAEYVAGAMIAHNVVIQAIKTSCVIKHEWILPVHARICTRPILSFACLLTAELLSPNLCELLMRYAPDVRSLKHDDPTVQQWLEHHRAWHVAAGPYLTPQEDPKRYIQSSEGLEEEFMEALMQPTLLQCMGGLVEV